MQFECEWEGLVHDKAEEWEFGALYWASLSMNAPSSIGFKTVDAIPQEGMVAKSSYLLTPYIYKHAHTYIHNARDLACLLVLAKISE